MQPQSIWQELGRYVLKTVILTGAELRHSFMRKAIALTDDISVLRTYCEGTEKNLKRFVEAQETTTDFRLAHLAARERTESDFFSTFVTITPDRSNPVFIPKGDINLPRYNDDIQALKPDLLVAYGCSLIREPLLSQFEGRFLNVHLGLSPYYRGGGTNFWPLVEGRPEFVGATFMYIDAGVDTGEVIHQIRARIFPGDTPHQIGNRLIGDVALVYAEIIRSFRQLTRMDQIPKSDSDKVFKRVDFSEESVRDLYRRFDKGLIESYLSNADHRIASAPIVVNPCIRPLEELLS